MDKASNAISTNTWLVALRRGVHAGDETTSVGFYTVRKCRSAKEGFNVCVSRFDLAKTSMQVPTSATNQEVTQ